MLKIRCLGIVLLIIGLTACANFDNEDAQTDDATDNLQPINYETEKEKNDRLGTGEQNIGEQGGYPQSDQERLNVGDRNGTTDLYTNDETVEAAERLQKQKEIKQAQVALTDEKVVVGVMLNKHASADISNKIKKQIKQQYPDRKVVVYTDDIYWDRMRNKDAEPDQMNGSMKEFLNEFFNRDREEKE